MTWVVTGGAGYIGAHVVRAFRERGLPVAVVDTCPPGTGSSSPTASRSFMRMSRTPQR